MRRDDVAEGVEGLLRDKSRPGRIAPLPADKKLAVFQKTATKKPEGATHWGMTRMAEATA